MKQNKPKELQSWQIDKGAQESQDKGAKNFYDKAVKPKELEWEKEFDKKFYDLKIPPNIMSKSYDDINKYAREKVKDFIKALLTQQRTELLEEIKKDKRYSLQLVDKDGVVKENIGLFVINGELSLTASYNNGLGLKPVIKKYTNLLNKKDE